MTRVRINQSGTATKVFCNQPSICNHLHYVPFVLKHIMTQSVQNEKKQILNTKWLFKFERINTDDVIVMSSG